MDICDKITSITRSNVALLLYQLYQFYSYSDQIWAKTLENAWKRSLRLQLVVFFETWESITNCYGVIVSLDNLFFRRLKNSGWIHSKKCWTGACDYAVELPHWSYCSWFDVCWSFGVVSVLQVEACNMDTTPTQPHRNSNTHRTKNNTTNVVIQQNSPDDGYINVRNMLST